jgi:hypothetical protein
MSRRSKRRHRQQKDKNHAPRLEHPAAPGQSSKGGTKGRALLIGGAVVVVAAVLYAVSGSGGRKGEIAVGSVTNSAPSATSAPGPWLPLATAAPISVAAGSGPKIQFATPIYDFGTVKGGEVVKYTYVFTNIGGAMLQVSNVQVSCGCTTAGEWTRQVEPGKTGSIPIQFNSGSYSGAVGKSITVTCNDTNEPTVVLQIKGNIWKPIDVTPQFAVLNVTADAPSNSTTVRIVNNEEAPLTLSAPESNNPTFAAELKTNQPGRQFELVLRTVPPLPKGNVQGQITLKTSSTNLPVISVGAWANVQPVVMMTPAQIVLPAAPLASPMPSTVSIRNNGTNTLTLSEPVVNAKGVDVQLKETEPGRAFAVTLSFPVGFEIAQGERVELSVKSSHPQFPTIKVPVIQPPRPAPSVVPVGTPAVGPSASK